MTRTMSDCARCSVSRRWGWPGFVNHKTFLIVTAVPRYTAENNRRVFHLHRSKTSDSSLPLAWSGPFAD